jgi:hypothetical protein
LECFEFFCDFEGPFELGDGIHDGFTGLMKAKNRTPGATWLALLCLVNRVKGRIPYQVMIKGMCLFKCGSVNGTVPCVRQSLRFIKQPLLLT